MKNSIFVLLALCAISFSCQEKLAEEKSDEFPAIIILEGKKTGIEVLGIPKVTTYKGDLVVLNKKDSLLFKVYNSDFEFITGYGQMSEFPLELKFPMFSSPVISEDNDYLPIFDLENLNSIKLWPNLTGEIGDWKYEKTKLKNFQSYPTTLIFLSDSAIAYIPEMGGSLAINYQGSKPGVIKPYHFKEFSKIRTTNLRWVFQSEAAVHVPKEVMVIAPLMTGELEYYDLQGELIKAVAYDTTNLQGNMFAEENFLNTNLIITALDLSVTDKFIYLLSSNNKTNEHKTGIKTNNSSVYKFDWDGKILQRYDLGVDASSFGVDEARSRFYVTVVENDEDPIWYFEF